MRIATVCFDYDDCFNFRRLLDVFRRSIAVNMPGVEIDALDCAAPKSIFPGNMLSWASNTVKLRTWAKYIAEATEPIAICDCDMLCLRSIESAFNQDFDIAFTERTCKEIPFNNGLLFVRPTAASRSFFQRWHEINLRMYRDKPLHHNWQRRYTGMNQSAFGWMLNHPHTAKLATFPCKEWNACNDDWPYVNETTRMLHVKGALRKYVLADIPLSGIPVPLHKAVKMWREYAG